MGSIIDRMFELFEERREVNLNLNRCLDISFTGLIGIGIVGYYVLEGLKIIYHG